MGCFNAVMMDICSASPFEKGGLRGIVLGRSDSLILPCAISINAIPPNLPFSKGGT